MQYAIIQKDSNYQPTTAMYIPNCIRNLGETLSLAVFVMMMITALCFIAYVFAPFSPIITLLFVIGGTALSFQSNSTATLAITGLALYVASWFILSRFGETVSILTCACGILIWFWAVILTIPPIFNPKPSPTK
jgi:hypothetical protein